MSIFLKLIPVRFDALMVWRLVLVSHESRDNNTLLLQEMAHYREQRNCGVSLWFLLYAMSAEVHGYLRQIVAGGISLERAATLLMQHRVNINYGQAACPLVSATGLNG